MKILKISVSVAFAMLLMLSLTMPVFASPTTTTKLVTEVPDIPTGLKLSCYDGPNSPSPSNPSSTCPVIEWGGYTYWPYSHIDNSVGMTIVAYDANGNVVKQLPRLGARYVWQITNDETAKTVTIWGQSSNTIVMTWDELVLPADAGDDLTVNEGDTANFRGYFTDRDSDTISWDFGDGSPAVSGTLTPSHVYADDGVYTATLTTTHAGVVETDTLTVTVNNVAPTVGPITAPIDPVAVNTLITASALFTDPGTLDTHVAEWDWGDGTTVGTVDSGSVTDSHTYITPGVYTITLTVTDDDSGEGYSVYQYVVVYDPSAGFVTGGGWINSPSGAYLDPACTGICPDPTGKANFGFVSKYKKGATTPTGQTQFQFKAGDLNFHSDSYQWLVIAGAHAKYKGEGTINGIGNYGFMLTATDNDINGGDLVDTFRIKIWDIDNSDFVVYDNLRGLPDDDNSGTDLEGGSIRIHTGK